MVLASLRKAGYVFCIVEGLLSAVAPRLSAKLNARLWLTGFDNVGELEVKDWYARVVRATGVGMLAAGGVALLLESRAEAAAAEAEDEGDEDDDDDVVFEVVGEDDEDDDDEAAESDADDADGSDDADDEE